MLAPVRAEVPAGQYQVALNPDADVPKGRDTVYRHIEMRRSFNGT
ncbi:hypothetical protein [Streptomyces sp. NPDC059122]